MNLGHSDLNVCPFAAAGDGERTFYRVAQLDDAMIEQIRLEGTFSDPAFFSPSLLEARALTYPGNVYMEMQGHSARYISPLAYNPLDEEVLFPPKTRFRVLDFEMDGGPDGMLYLILKEAPE